MHYILFVINIFALLGNNGAKMTAEIAVYNKTAVALAADSAVTISGGNTYKINNGAEKLFALSKHHPVGIMVYGNGSLCGVPWEMIIKAFRKYLKDESFPTLEGYADKFWDFLSKATNIIPPDVRDFHLDVFYSEHIFNSVVSYVDENKIDPLLKSNKSVSEEDVYNFMEEACNVFSNYIEQEKDLEGVDESSCNDVRGFAHTIAARIMHDRFSVLKAIPPDSLINALANLFAKATCKKSIFGNNTGVVIAGYGEDEYFPSVLAFDVLGFFGERLLRYSNLSKSSFAGESGVTAFAQEEEVHAFMQGVSGDLKYYIYDTIKEAGNILVERIETLIDAQEIQGDPSIKDEASDAIKSVTEHSLQNIENYMKAKYVSKVVEMIEFLTKSDLGYMAESLVNLTAFKRKVSNDSETVGGPIDVAIISKGDGFVWVQRKHYFNRELNNDYFNRQ